MTKIIKAVDEKIANQIRDTVQLSKIAIDFDYDKAQKIRKDANDLRKKTDFFKKLNKSLIALEKRL